MVYQPAFAPGNAQAIKTGYVGGPAAPFLVGASFGCFFNFATQGLGQVDTLQFSSIFTSGGGSGFRVSVQSNGDCQVTLTDVTGTGTRWPFALGAISISASHHIHIEVFGGAPHVYFDGVEFFPGGTFGNNIIQVGQSLVIETFSGAIGVIGETVVSFVYVIDQLVPFDDPGIIC